MVSYKQPSYYKYSFPRPEPQYAPSIQLNSPPHSGQFVYPPRVLNITDCMETRRTMYLIRNVPCCDASTASRDTTEWNGCLYCYKPRKMSLKWWPLATIESGISLAKQPRRHLAEEIIVNFIQKSGQ